MRKIMLLSLMATSLSAVLFSCKKDNNSALIGKWTLTDTVSTYNYVANQTLNFTDNTHYILTTGITGATYRDTGTYSSLYGNTVVFTSTGTTSPCLNFPGTYTYIVTGNNLLLSASYDSCFFGNITRSSYINSPNWAKQ